MRRVRRGNDTTGRGGGRDDDGCRPNDTGVRGCRTLHFETAADMTERPGGGLLEKVEKALVETLLCRVEVSGDACKWSKSFGATFVQSWKKGLNGSIASKIPMHRGAVVSCNCLIQGGRDINEPFVLEVSCFSGQVLIVFPGHKAGLI